MSFPQKLWRLTTDCWDASGGQVTRLGTMRFAAWLVGAKEKTSFAYKFARGCKKKIGGGYELNGNSLDTRNSQEYAAFAK
jgi:hypothetical protein